MQHVVFFATKYGRAENYRKIAESVEKQRENAIAKKLAQLLRYA